MSQTTNSRYEDETICCFVCIIIVFGFITLIISPILGTIVTVTLSLTILLVLILRSKKSEETAPESNHVLPPHSEILDSNENDRFEPVESVRVRFLDTDTPTPDSKITIIEEKKEAQVKTEAEKLQEQIAQLEKRIKLLNEQLAKAPFAELSIEPITPDSTVPSKAELEGEEELTVVAIQHLLETLNEKFAKRAISEQLYDRLRDKYLARMEKAKRRSKTSSPGIKKDQNR